MLGFLPQEVPALSPAARRSRHSSLSALIASSFLSAILVFAVVAVTVPGDVLGASLSKVALCSANLRTSPSTSARVRKVIATGTKVSANLRLVGAQLADDVRGQGRLGPQLVPDHRDQRQERQVALRRDLPVRSGRPVQDLRPAARHQVRRLPGEPALERLDGCHLATVINTDTKVLVATQVTGSSYSTTCSGKAVSGKSWYRISSVNGKSVKSLYGVTYLYSATGLYKSTVSTSGQPDPAAAAARRPPPPSGYTEGIDISHWQGTINWTKVAAAGKRFAFMKASESTDFVDNTYTTNRAAGARRGPLRRRLSLRPAEHRRRRRDRRSRPFHQHRRTGQR